ncbi:MAG: LysR family transcriptional regulator [Chromatiales bacterium]|nr:LysR family transcriptional regulator [Chromatiales bacterium]
MDIKQLRYFMGVLEAKSITKAAEQLYVAQPALGLQIRKLEEELGVDLFVRHSRGVAPTEAGMLLAQHAQVLLRQFARARQDLLDFARSPHGRVTVGFTPTVTSVLVAEFAGRCREHFPDVVLNISGGLSDHLNQWVDDDQIDLSLSYNKGTGTGLSAEPLAQEVLYFVQLNDGSGGGIDDETVSFRHVSTHPLVLPSRPHILRVLVDEELQRSELESKIIFEVDSVWAMKELALHGVAGTVMPIGAVRHEVVEGRLRARRIVEPDLSRTLYMIQSRRRPASKAISAVSRLLRETVGDLAQRTGVGWQPYVKA